MFTGGSCKFSMSVPWPGDCLAKSFEGDLSGEVGEYLHQNQVKEMWLDY